MKKEIEMEETKYSESKIYIHTSTESVYQWKVLGKWSQYKKSPSAR